MIPRLPERAVSKSMIAFWLAAAGVLALAVQTWLPGLIGKDSGVHVTRPSLLTVADDAKGLVPLGGGMEVSLYDSGLRVRDHDGVLLDTVIRGAPLSAATGSVTGSGGRRVEHVRELASIVTIETLRAGAGRASYAGEISDRSATWPLSLDVTAEEGAVTIAAHVPGVDAIVWHLTTDYDVQGYGPGLPERNLRNRAWWLRPSEDRGPAFTSMRGADIGIVPGDAQRALDLRETGRIDAHVWSDRSALIVTRRVPPPPRTAP